VKGAVGSVTSPKYPNVYPKNSICATKILTPPGSQVYLKFEDFSLENSQYCARDYVSVTSTSGTPGSKRRKKCYRSKVVSNWPNKNISEGGCRNNQDLEFFGPILHIWRLHFCSKPLAVWCQYIC